MKKTVLTIAVTVLICVMLVTCVACNYEKKYADKLQNLGYEVEVIKSKIYGAYDEGSCYLIYAYRSNSKYENDTDYVSIYVFDKKADAERKYSLLMSDRDGYELVYRDGKAVIYGSAQGVSDARS